MKDVDNQPIEQLLEITKNGKIDDFKHNTLEEAILATKFGKYQIILTVLTTINLLGSSLENSSIGYILPYAKCDLNLSIKEQGVLIGISYFGIVCSSHLWGFLSDTWGRNKVLQITAAGAFILSFSSAFAMDFYTLTIFRFFVGAFVAGSTSAAYSYISEFHSSATAPRAAAFISFGLNCGWFAMSPIAILIMPMDWTYSLYFVEFKPWRLFLLCISFVNLFNAIVSKFLPESPKFLLAMNRKEEAFDVLRRIYAINTGKSRNSYPVKSIENVTLGNSISNAQGIGEFFRLVVKQTTPIFQTPMLTNTWKLSYIIFAVFLITHGTFSWFAEFLHEMINSGGTPKILCDVIRLKTFANSTNQICEINNKNTESFQLLFVTGACFAILSVVSSAYLKKITPKILVCTWLIISMIGGILVNFVSNLYVIVICFFFFLSCSTCSCIVMAIAVNLYPTNYRAMATSFIMIAGRMGSMGGSNFIGLMLQNHCTMIFYLYGGLLISCAIVFMTIKIKPQ